MKGRAHRKGRLFWGGVKEFLDGSLGSRTALMREPYEDNELTNGTRVIDLERLQRLVGKAHAAGLQVAVHAIGDRAVDELVGVYERLEQDQQQKEHQHQQQEDEQQQQHHQQHQGECIPQHHAIKGLKRDRKISEASATSTNAIRHRIEHAQHIGGATTARRIAQADIITSPNPLHLLTDRAMLRQRLGAVRAGAGHAFAYKTLSEAGVTMAFSSDWPVVDLDPLGSVHMAAFRKLPHEQGEPWAADEQIPLEQALVGHTAAGATAGMVDSLVGRLIPGHKADFVVLNASLFVAGAAQTGQTAYSSLPRVLRTYVDGSCAYGCGQSAS